MKKVLRNYFDNLIYLYQKKHNSFPVTSVQDDVADFIYLNKSDNDWVEWKPIEKTEITDFSELEYEFEIEIHQSVKNYFNSFWFCALGGKFDEKTIQLFEVLPNIETIELKNSLMGYKLAHNHLNFIPIGFETNESLLIVIENSTGNIFIEDYEQNSFEKIAESLEELIGNLIP